MIYCQARSRTSCLPREGFTSGSNHQFTVLNTTQPAYFLNASIIDPSAQMHLQMKKGHFIKANSAHSIKLMFSLLCHNTLRWKCMPTHMSLTEFKYLWYKRETICGVAHNSLFGKHRADVEYAQGVFCRCVSVIMLTGIFTPRIASRCLWRASRPEKLSLDNKMWWAPGSAALQLWGGVHKYRLCRCRSESKPCVI